MPTGAELIEAAGQSRMLQYQLQQQQYQQQLHQFKQGSSQSQSAPQDKVLADFQAAQQKANATNESRYQDILGKYNQLAQSQSQNISGVPQDYQNIANAYGARTDQAMGMLAGQGDTQRAELKAGLDQRNAGTQQDLINRGLTNSTAYDAAIRGNSQDYEKNKRALEENLTKQKLGLYTDLSGQQLSAQAAVPSAKLGVANQTFGMQQAPLGFMERRNDVGPSYSDIAQYASATGAGRAANPYGGSFQYMQSPQTMPAMTGTLDR